MAPKKNKKESPGDDFSKWTVAKLKARLIELGLDNSGNKAVLVERLQSAPSTDSLPAAKKQKTNASEAGKVSNKEEPPAKKSKKAAAASEAKPEAPKNVTQLEPAAQVYFEKGEFKAEYAKSGRSTCKRCNEKIDQDTMRLAKMVPSDKFDGNIPLWNHADCFLNGGLLPETRSLIAGFSTLRPEDQQVIMAKVPATAGEAGAAPEEDTGENEAIAEQNNKVFAVKDAFEKLAKGDLEEMLELNGYPTKKLRVNSSLSDLAADGIMFGATDRCTVCADADNARLGGHVLLDGERYKCTGFISEFLKCSYRTQTPSRSVWQLTEAAMEVGTLKKVKLQTGERLFASGLRDEVEAAPGEGTEQALPALLGLQIVVEGTAAAKKKLTKQVTENGAQLLESVSKACSCVVTTQAWADKNEAAVEAAKELGVPGVTQSFLTESIKGGRWTGMEKHMLWGEPRRQTGRENRQAKATSKQKVKRGLSIDEEVGKKVMDIAHVLVDKDTVYSETLNAADMVSGRNSYYILYLLQSDKSMKSEDGEKGVQYWVFRKWGRIGVNQGDHKLEPFATDKAGALKSFCKVYSEKTGNEFGIPHADFIPHAGKMSRVDIKHDTTQGDNNTTQSADNDSGQPLGQLSKNQIEKADTVLDRIEVLLAGAQTEATLPKILAATAEFYSLVPHDFGLGKPPPIDTDQMLGAEKALLQFYLRMGYEGIEEGDGKERTPIGGVMDLPLCETLAEGAVGLCSTSEVKRCVKIGNKLVKKNAGNPSEPISADLYATILLYTGNAIYKDLNLALREEDRKRVRKYFSYLRMLLEACDRLPAKDCTLWRGIGVDLFEQYKVGSTITWWGVSSCTADKQVAQNFANSCGSGSTFLTIETTTACPISEVSVYPSESESILLPGTMLEVVSAVHKGKQAQITLREVGRCVG